MDELEQLAELRVGTEISGFRLERVLGVGSMASVYACRAPDGSTAALKVLHAHFNTVATVRSRFLREGPLGSALATISPLCDGIPRVIESGLAEDGSAYLAMELLEGETVFDLASRHGTLPVPDALAILSAVLDVLVVAHSHGIIHRDLKPENLHVGAGGKIKVLDFGIARVLDQLPEAVGFLPEKSATKIGTQLGTSEYMAPEQAMGSIDSIDGRTDLFGLAATGFRLLAGRTIHGHLEGARLLIAAATEAAPSVAKFAPDLAPAVVAVIDRGLAFAKTERYPDALTMRADVRALRANKPPPYVTAIAEGRVAPGAPLAR